MSSTDDTGQEELTPEEKGDIAEAGLENLLTALRAWYVPPDAMIEEGALLAMGPDGEKIRCPDYISFTPEGGLHEAKYREYARTWTPHDDDDVDEPDERVYIVQERWDDYCRHARWSSVIVWVYIATSSTWIRQSVADLSPVDDGTIRVADGQGGYEMKQVYWFSTDQFDEFRMLDDI